MRIGYARVSTPDQNIKPQIEDLESANCQLIFEEKITSGRWNRPELHRLLERLQPNDVLVVWKLDRLARSLKDFLLILDKIQFCGAGFLSLTESIDTTTAAGRLMMQMLGAFAEFERGTLRERTQQGLQFAKQQGRLGGRPSKLTLHQKAEIIWLIKTQQKTAAETARLFRVHRATISRLLATHDSVVP